MNQNVKPDKKKERETILTHALSHDGRGIATIENKTTFISGALSNEEVVYQFTQKRGQFNEAKAIEIVRPSPDRVTPPCAHFGVCGGCSLQHMSMDRQLQLKQQTLLDQLKHFGKTTPEHILPPLTALTTGYRRKARLGVKHVFKKNKVLVGFREKSSHYLAELTHCEILHPVVGKHLPALSTLIAQLSISNNIPQIEVAMGDETVALVFRHLEPFTSADLEQLRAFGEQYQFHIYLQPNSPAAIQKLWPADGVERITYSLPDAGLTYLFHPLDFTQINLEVNRLVIRQAISLLSLAPTDNVLDLFCGIGNFTLPIAKHAAQVVGIEGSEDMVHRAQANALHNQIDNVFFYAANLMEPPPQAAWLNTTYHKILLDPPRVGAKELLPYIPRLAAQKIVYVSCNPATLARDAGELVHKYGYRLTHAGIMNMFPHTAHIEAMAVFEKS